MKVEVTHIFNIIYYTFSISYIFNFHILPWWCGTLWVYYWLRWWCTGFHQPEAKGVLLYSGWWCYFLTHHHWHWPKRSAQSILPFFPNSGVAGQVNCTLACQQVYFGGDGMSQSHASILDDECDRGLERVKICCRGENDELLFVVSALKNGGLVLGMLVFNKSSLS